MHACATLARQGMGFAQHIYWRTRYMACSTLSRARKEAIVEMTRRTKFMPAYVFIVEGVIVLTVGFATNPHVNREFFSVASQILPLLLLAVIIDLRALASRQPRAVVGLLILSFLVGEAVALAIVGNRKPVITSSWWLGLVVASLVGLALLIGLRSWVRPADP
jgi:hypothetical protein